MAITAEILMKRDVYKRQGLNGVRMFLPFHIWYHEKKDFLDRLDSFLEELAARGITMMPVLFNDCVGFGRPEAVSYTHLDVYKRQIFSRWIHLANLILRWKFP